MTSTVPRAALILLAVLVLGLAVRSGLVGQIREAALLSLSALVLIGLVRRHPAPGPTPSLAPVIAALAFAVWATGFIALTSTAGPAGHRYFCLFDDAMVSMRYAWNLAHGQGLVWNPHERVEGFTNLLMTLVMAVPARLLDKSSAVLSIQVLGAPIVLAAALLSLAIAKRVADDQAAPAWAFVAVLAYYPLSYWTLMGMETGLLTVILLGATLQVLRHEDDGRFQWTLVMLLAGAVLTRPDAVVPASVLLLFRAAGLPSGRRRSVRWESAAIAALLGGLTALRLAYFGEPLPNTYYLKMEGYPLAVRCARGLRFVLPFLAWMSPALGLAARGVIVRRDRRTLLLAAISASALLTQVWVGGDAWPRWRMLCPAVPLILILMIEGASSLRDAAASPAARRAMAAAVSLGLVVANGAFVRELFLASYPFSVTDNQANVTAGLELARICAPTARVGVFYAGTVPYYSGLPAVDFLGKCDRRIAHLPPDLSLAVGHNKYDLQYSIVEQQPDYVEKFQWAREDLSAFAQENYVRVNGLWLRRGSPNVRWELLR